MWWAAGLVGARPVERKKSGASGIDGRLYFYDKSGGGILHLGLGEPPATPDPNCGGAAGWQGHRHATAPPGQQHVQESAQGDGRERTDEGAALSRRRTAYMDTGAPAMKWKPSEFVK